MKIMAPDENTVIKDIEAWQKEFCKCNKEQLWKEGFSAHSLAKYILSHRRGGGTEIRKALNSVLGNDSVKFLCKAFIEQKCNFDGDHRHPRHQDIGIFGKTEKGRKLYVGVEAKVCEYFGNDTIESKRRKGKGLVRLKALCSWLHVSENDEEIQKLRYQLFHFTKATADVDANICVLLLLTFKTKQYKLEDGERNANDWEAFMERFFD